MIPHNIFLTKDKSDTNSRKTFIYSYHASYIGIVLNVPVTHSQTLYRKFYYMVELVLLLNYVTTLYDFIVKVECK